MKKKAALLFEDRMEYPDVAIVEMKVWLLPERDTERPHGLKYRLFYGSDGERIVCYDNERGNGNHRHYRGSEETYLFTTAERLMADFIADVKRERSKK